MPSTFDGEKIWIIGASSGIGKALAYHLAAEGAHLYLSARRSDRLTELQSTLPNSSQHVSIAFDVSKHDQFQETIAQIYNNHEGVDRIINLAAIYTPSSIQNMDYETAMSILDVNLKGTLNFLHVLQPYITELSTYKKPQISVCGSVAGYAGLPNGQPYSATKAGVISMVESFQAERPDLNIKLINPGFVKTKLTNKNDFDMPMIIKPEEAAQFIAQGLRKKSFEIHFPKIFTYMMKIVASLPYFVYFKIIRKLTNIK